MVGGLRGIADGSPKVPLLSSKLFIEVFSATSGVVQLHVMHLRYLIIYSLWHNLR